MRPGAARSIVGLAGLAVLVAIDANRSASAHEGEGQSTVQVSGGEASPAIDESEAGESRDRARALFADGQIHYSLGEYAQAIARFRQAYELSSAPALLFNIAQAHRLNGECAQAIEIYRHFIRLAPDAAQVGDAEAQIRALTPSCSTGLRARGPQDAPPSPTTASPPRVGTAPTASADVVQAKAAEPADARITSGGRPWSTRARIATALLATGIMVGAGAGLLYWWNDTRYDRWSAEDRRLATEPGTANSPATGVARQDSNDALLRSIWRIDTTVAVLAVVSAACVVGSATLGVLPERAPTVAIGPGEIHVAWQVHWR